MRLIHYLTEADAPSGDAPKEELSPEEEAAEQKIKDLDKIVDGVKMATDKNKINNMVKMAAALYKDYGEQWLSDLEKKLAIDIVPETVERFMRITKNFSEKLTHIKPKEGE